jgi:endoglucanase
MHRREFSKFIAANAALVTGSAYADNNTKDSNSAQTSTPGSRGNSTTASTPTSTAVEVSYPFGSHQTSYVAGITPSVVNQQTQDALIRTRYDTWKSGLSARCGGTVVVFSSSYATVSEGMGYGMLLAVLMAGHDKDAKTLFDSLFKVVRAHPAYNLNPNSSLMEWRLRPDCSSAGGGWNAMDGDLDIAMALLMADRQWGSAGTVDYKAEGLKTIAALKLHNMSAVGHTKGLPNPNHSRTSDYMITHFKAFKRVTGDGYWDLATNTAFQLLDLMQAKYSPATGLIPDFIVNLDSSAAPSPGWIADSNANEGFYYWNACRLPWRLASDYVTTGDTRSKVIASKLTDFFERSSGGQPNRIAAGYKLDGTVLSNYAAPAFIGPATAGAMVDGRFQSFLNSLWSYSSAHPGSGYYESELQLISLIVASGNWWNP